MKKVYLFLLFFIIPLVFAVGEIKEKVLITEITEDILIGYKPNFTRVEYSKIIEVCSNQTINQTLFFNCQNQTKSSNKTIKTGEIPAYKKRIVALEYTDKRIDFDSKICFYCVDLIYCISKKDGGSYERGEQFKCMLRSGESGFIINTTSDKIIYKRSDIGEI